MKSPVVKIIIKVKFIIIIKSKTVIYSKNIGENTNLVISLKNKSIKTPKIN